MKFGVNLGRVDERDDVEMEESSGGVVNEPVGW